VSTVAHGTGFEHRSSIFLSLLPPTSGDRRVATAVIVLSAATFAALVPFAKEPLAPVPAFIPAYQSALFISDLITAAVLYGQFAIQRTRGVLLVAAGYLFTGLCTIPHTLSFPGLFGPEGIIGAGPQTTVWLYMLWHAGFPILMMVYAFLKDDDRIIAAPWSVAVLSMVAVALVVTAGTLLTTEGHAFLPVLLRPDNSYTPAMSVLVLGVWSLAPLALALVWLRRPRTALDLWILVVMVIWTCEVGLSAALNAKRFDLGFYIGRLFGLVAANFVLVMLLLNVRALYVRLASELAKARDASDQALQRTRELYRTLFETNPYAVLVSEFATRRIVAANETAAAQYGWSRDDLLSMRIDDLVVPEDLPRQAAWRTTLAPGARSHLEGVRHRKADGTLLDVDVVGRLIEYDNKPAVLAISSDISERRRTERLAERIFETSEDIILIVDSYGRIVQISRSATKAIGYAPEEVIGRLTADFIFPDDLETTRHEVQMARQSRSARGFRCRYIAKSGQAVSLFWRGVWSEADHHYFFIGRDVTDIEAKEEQLRQAQKMEAVGQLTGGVAHDFNNILMVILANVEELLEERRLGTEQREMLEAIKTSGERAAEMTRWLLAFSRKQHLMPQPTDLTELVSGIDKLLRRTLGEQIEIEAVLADDLWITSVDRSQLEAALVNLSVNARDAMPDGGKLLIETRNAMLDLDYAAQNTGVTAGDYVVLSVSDTGTGIPPELLNKVFEPFFTTKEVGKGTGLGLSMVYGFIKQSNGHIKVYSEVGRGTTVKMYLPRAETSAVGADRIAVASPHGTERILLVEDSEQVRKSVLMQLRSLGYTVTEASDGLAALALLDAGAEFDLMLTDVVMPGMDGPQAAALARQRRPEMKVVFMSGYSELAAVNHGRIAPDAEILSKPFRKVDLAQRLRETLDRGRATPAADSGDPR
jgi:PAS domain S-box-containing protein